MKNSPFSAFTIRPFGFHSLGHYFLVFSVLVFFSCSGSKKTGTGGSAEQDKNGSTDSEQSIATESVTDLKIENINWELIEMLGKPVQLPAGVTKKIFLHLDSEKKVAYGFSGCNSFRGGYVLSNKFRLKFNPLAGTLMACEQMEIEKQFLETMAMVDNFTVSTTGELSLNKARMAPLLRFKQTAEE